MNRVVNTPEQGRDYVWEAFVGLIQDDNEDWECLWGRPVEETDISVRAARAMKHATGHESVGLFKFGYMLYIVRTCTAYTLDDLAYVMSHDWDFPTDDPNLPDHVRDMMFFPCHLIEKTSNEELDEFLRNVCNPHEMPAEIQMFLEGYGPDETWSIPRKTILPIQIIEAVMCAEIWFSTQGELWQHFLLFYSGEVEFLANIDILIELAGTI
ncbi:hypothetical protein CIB48_g4598 [Xylaria polymorpha]|nr:hypothetical protein CIB48_g4598 [Xylaria polymorpha]